MNPFAYRARSIHGPATDALPVTPDDATDLPMVAIAHSAIMGSSAGATGVWYDPYDLSTLFQEVQGTVPATADGDPVALVRDKSGNGLDMLQTLASRRPVLRRTGALVWLEFDGFDDRMDCPSLSYTNSTTGSVVGIKYASGDTAYGTLRGVYSACPMPLPAFRAKETWVAFPSTLEAPSSLSMAPQHRPRGTGSVRH